MQVFNLTQEAEFSPAKHVEKILGRAQDGDFTVACWEPGQISPYHCHPDATEIYFCFEGGGTMRPARCTNMPMGPPARCCSASATGRIWRRATGNGAAGRGGRKAPPTPNITGRIR
jgi:hypothetical protein